MKKILCLLLALFMCFPTLNINVYALENEVIIDVTDYGADPSGINDSTEAIYNALEAAKEEGKDGKAVTVNFPKGEYHIYKDKAQQREYHTSNTNSIQNPTKYIGILIENQENLTIEGNDSLFMMHGNMMALAVAYSKNITLRNFAWDFEVPTVTEMTVTNVTSSYTDYYIPSCFPYEVSGNSILWSSDISPYTNQPYWSGRNHDVDGHGTYAVVGYHPDDEMSRNYYVNDGPLGNVSRIEKLGDNEVRVYYSYRSGAQQSNQKKGTIFELCSNQHRQTAGAFTYESENVLSENVSVHFMHGFGWLIQMSKNVYYKKCNLVPRENSGHVTVSFADGIHASGAAGEIVIEDTNFANTHDDPINIHGTFTRVESLDTANNTLTLKYIHTQQGGFPQYHVGDEVQFFTRDTLESSDNEAVYTVKNIIQDTNESSDLRTMIVEFEETLPSYLTQRIGSEPKYVAENITYAPSVTVRGCTFRNVPTRGILCTTRNKVTIENNIFYNMSMATIFLSNDSDEWYESGPIRDMTIKGNTFYIKDIGRTAWTYASAIYVHPVTKGGGLPAATNPIHKNITIEDNTFYMDLDTVVKAESVENLTFRNNKVYRLNPEVNVSIDASKSNINVGEALVLNTNANGNTNNGTIDNIFNFTKCKDVLIEGNTYDDGLKLYAVSDQATINNGLTVKDEDIKVVNNEGQAVSDPVREIKYASMNPDIATVDHQGKITGVKAGKAKIFAYYEWNDTIIQSNVIEITVGSSSSASEDIEIECTKTDDYYVSFDASNNNTLTFNEKNDLDVQWSVTDFKTSSSTDIATINQDGVLTAHKEGIVWVNATLADKSERVPVLIYGNGTYGLDASFSIVREDSANYKVSNNGLEIKAQSGNDLWQWDNNLENLFLYDVENDDDFRAVVKVENLPVRENNKWDTVSLILYQGDDDYYTIGKKSHFDGFATVKERSQTAIETGGNSAHNTTSTAYLGISKAGDKITLDYSLDGQTWNQAGSYTDSTIQNCKIGFGAWGSARTAIFSDFKVSTTDVSYADLMDEDSIEWTKGTNDRPFARNIVLSKTNTGVEVSYDYSDKDNEGQSYVEWMYEENGKDVSVITNEKSLDIAGVSSIRVRVYPVDVYGTPGYPTPVVSKSLMSEDSYELHSINVNSDQVIERNGDKDVDIQIPDSLDKVELSWVSVNNALGTVEVYKNDQKLTYNNNSIIVDVEDLDVLKVKKDSHVYTVTVHTIKSNNTDINSIKVDDYVYEINSSEAHYFDCKDINRTGIIEIDAHEDVDKIIVTMGHDRKELKVTKEGHVYKAEYALVSGLNPIYVTAVAKDGITTTQYMMMTTYVSNVDLSVENIILNDKELDGFNSEQLVYDYEMDTGDSLKVKVNTGDHDVIYSLNNEIKTGKEVTYNELQDGENVLKIVVKSKEDTSKLTYTVNIMKHYPTNTNIKEILLNKTDITNTFENNKTQQYVSQDTVELKVTPQDPKATVTIKLGGKEITEDTFKVYKNLNDVKVIITASDGITKEEYTVDLEKAVYLSDIKWAVDSPGWFPNYKDCSGDNGEQTISVIIDGKKVDFAKGVGAHANSTIEVDLTNKGYSKFTAYAGINGNQTNPGDVIFYVYLDGQLVEQTRQVGGQNAKYIDLDISQANRLKLVIDKNGQDSYDHGTWADAKFSSEFTDTYEGPIAIDPESVTLNKDKAELTEGETISLTATVLPENTTDKTVTWLTSDKTIATVENGVVKAIKAGTATITVTTINGKTATFEITVKAKQPVEKPFPFEDVFKGQWYYEYVDQAYQLGLMTGATETLFKPTVSMNRGMVAIVLHRMEGAEEVAYAPIFPDVYDKQYFTTAVMWAKQTGIITGYNNGTFMPLKEVTREEMATMIQRFAKYKGLDVASSKDITYFQDYADISTYAKAPIQWCVENGVLSGKFEGTKVDPLGTATRAECAKMLVQAYKVIYK